MMTYASGGKIPGKAKVKGDSPKNDLVDIKVSPGEIVIPRTVVAKGKDAIADFATAALSNDKNNYYEGGKVKPEPSIWENIKSAFDEEKPKPKKEVPKLDPDKARDFSSVFNTDKYFNGGPVAPKDFDPDKYIQEKLGKASPVTQQADISNFDPDKYIAEKLGAKPNDSDSILKKEVPVIGGTVGGYTKGLLSALPTVGGIGGGLAGAGLGPAGSVGGAGLGYAAGESLKKLGEKYILGEEPQSREQYLKDIAMAVPEGMSQEMGGQILGKGIGLIGESAIGKKVGDIASKVGTKIGETFSGVPEKEIATYAKNADKIKMMAKSSDNDVMEAADQMRKQFQASIDTTRRSLGNDIGAALKESNKAIDSKPILEALEKSKASIDPALDTGGIGKIDDLMNRIKQLGGESGAIPVAKANELKQFLQDQASSAYRMGGEIFPGGTDVARAAKGGAAVARGLINEAVPTVASANNQLANLHQIEDLLNINLIQEGKPAAALMAAGSGSNPANVKLLKRLGEATGTDMLGEAEKLASMRTFGSPKLMAVDATGKSAARMGLGAGVGFLTGGPSGAVIAAGLTSPAAVKTAIDAGLLTKAMLKQPEVQKVMSRGLIKTAEDLLNKKEK